MTKWLRAMLPQEARLTQKEELRYEKTQGFSSRLNRLRALSILIRDSGFESTSTK